MGRDIGRLILTVKPALLKSKLPKIVSKEEIKIDEIYLGMIKQIWDNGQVLVQFFNGIHARIPVGHLSLEYTEAANVKELFVVGQTKRTRILALPNENKSHAIGSFVLDEALRKEKIKKEAIASGTELYKPGQ